MVRGPAFWGVFFGLWLASSATAVAQPLTVQAAAAEPAPEYALDLLLAVQLTYYDSRDMEDAGLLGCTAELRHSILVAGAALNMGGSLPDSTVFNASLLGGLAWQTDLGLRFDLMGTFGADLYRARDWSFFERTGDPGATAVLAFAGARAGGWYRFASRGHRHFSVGAFASYEENLEHVTRRYSYPRQDDRIDTEHAFGDRRLAIALTFAVNFDLLP